MAEFIKQIQIEKVRHLENLTIDIAEDEMKHLIITGKNGSGKTTLLENVSFYLRAIPDGKLSKLLYEWPEYLQSCKRRYEALRNEKKSFTIQSEMEEMKGRISVATKLMDEYSKGVKVVFGDNTMLFEKFSRGEFVLAYFSAVE